MSCCPEAQSLYQCRVVVFPASLYDSLGRACCTQHDFPALHPIAWTTGVLRIPLLCQRTVAASFSVCFVGGPSMIVVVDQLGFIERTQVLCTCWIHEAGARQL